MGQLALLNFALSEKTGPLKPGVQEWKLPHQILAGTKAKLSLSNGFDYNNLPLQIVRPSLRPALIACNNIYFAYYKKRSCKNGFSERLSTIGATILRSYTASSSLEFGTSIPIRILEEFRSEFPITYTEKK